MVQLHESGICVQRIAFRILIFTCDIYGVNVSCEIYEVKSFGEKSWFDLSVAQLHLINISSRSWVI